MVGLSVFCAGAAAALDISLEENKAERGNIGFVDLKRVFGLYPATLKAKQSFGEIVRQAEEQVNLRRAELMALRSELSRFELERDLLVKEPLPAPPAPTPAPPPPAPAPSTPEGIASLPGMSRPLAGGTTETTTAIATDTTTATTTMATEGDAQGPAKPPPEPILINIPGVSPESIPIQDPSGAPSGPSGSAIAPDAGTVPVEAAAGAHTAESIAAALELRQRRLGELDAEIASRKELLAEKELKFRDYQQAVEKNLLDIESRRSEILLGKIYQAVREVARESGVSVVVDKNQILFGQDTVDLTQKVILKLKESAL